jgi:hypothetical protein
MKIIALSFIFLAACAKGPEQGAAPAPADTIKSGSGVFCRDLLVWSNGAAFLINQTDFSASIVPDGQYGYDAYTSGWASQIPACHYEIKNGIPAVLSQIP